MSKRGQRSGARWSLALLAGCLGIASAHAQQTSDGSEQGGFVVIEDTTPPPPPPKPLAIPAPVAAAGFAPAPAPAAPAPHYKPLPTLPPNALPLIERMPPPAAHPKPAAVLKAPKRPSTSFVVTVKRVNPAAEPYTIPAGTLLSQGLAKYVQRYGWSIRWLVSDDYRLDAPLPIPAGSVDAGVTYVVHTYQSQGGLLGDVPRFAKPNKVVVIQPVTADKESQ